MSRSDERSTLNSLTEAGGDTGCGVVGIILLFLLPILYIVAYIAYLLQ